MAKVTINGKEYDTAKLPKEAVDLLNSILFTENEIRKLQNQIKIYNVAKTVYLKEFQSLLDKLPHETKKG